MNATALAPRPVPWRPETRRGRYVFGVGFRQSGFQTVVARASRPCVGRTIRTGGTPVPLPWKRSGRSNFLCLTACRAREWLNTHSAPRRPEKGAGSLYVPISCRAPWSLFSEGAGICLAVAVVALRQPRRVQRRNARLRGSPCAAARGATRRSATSSTTPNRKETNVQFRTLILLLF